MLAGSHHASAVLVAAVVGCALGAEPAAQPSHPETSAATAGEGAPAAAPAQPPPAPGLTLNPEQPAPEVLPASTSGRFGAAGTRWITLGTGAGMDGRGATDITGFIQATWFIVQDVEFGGEVGLWHFDQEGQDAEGASIAALVRWHFVNEHRLSLFVDGGIGLLGSTGDVPAEGTDVNFLPRAGFGATYRPWDGDTRVMLGLRWHHISNARSSGAEDNPSRDGAMLYVGLSVPF
jgi:hypothetical protein